MVDFIVSLFEGFIYLFAFTRIAKLKKPGGFITALYAVYICAMCFTKHFWSNPFVLTALTVAGAFSFSCMFSITRQRRFYYSIILTMLSVITEIISGFIFISVTNNSITEIQSNASLYLIAAITSKFVFFLSVVIICAIKKRTSENINAIRRIIFIITPIVSIAVAYCLAYMTDHLQSANWLYVTTVLTIIVIINIAVYTINGILHAQTKRMLERERYEASLEANITQCASDISHGEERNRILHNVSMHINTMRELALSGKTDALQDYASKLDVGESLNSGGEMIQGYPALDIIIRQRVQKALELGVEFDHDIDIPLGLPIDTMDLCVLVGNAFDNAIEACERVDNDRKIKLVIVLTKNRLLVSIENTSPITEINEGTCKTTKADGSSHGYGIAIMKDIVSKYFGNVLLRYENNVFKFLALIFV